MQYVQYADVDAIIAYPLTEDALGTGEVNFESTDYQLKIEVALILFCYQGGYVALFHHGVVTG
jgi:hypothetical protein